MSVDSYANIRSLSLGVIVSTPTVTNGLRQSSMTRSLVFALFNNIEDLFGLQKSASFIKTLNGKSEGGLGRGGGPS